ncbi:MAG: hypothetical protein R6W91_07955 [Thermoplasmata archaeon]
MDEPQVKGDIILRVLDQVIIRWGRNGLDMIGFEPASYLEEHWYPFDDICDILSAIKSRLGNNNPLTVYQLGFRTIKSDPRWQDIFDDADPADVFLTTKRQEDLYRFGAQKAQVMGPKHVRIEMVGEPIDQLWLEFYRGRLQGVLELTGRTGVVHLLPASGDPPARTYDIKWG